jgi:hypothetical protein
VLSRISPLDIAATQAAAQGLTDIVVLLLCALKAWLEALGGCGGGGGAVSEPVWWAVAASGACGSGGSHPRAGRRS